MTTILGDKIGQSFFYEMAGSNLLLARNYLNSAFTGVLTHSESTCSQLLLKAIPIQSANPISIQLSLKNRCFNLIKAPLLLTRAPFLYMPLLNRVIQLALRCFSPKNPIDFINSCSSSPTKAEVRIRYNKPTLIEFVAQQHLDSNIQNGKEFNPSQFDKESTTEDTRQKLVDRYFGLSPALTLESINSPEFKEQEVKSRYSQDQLNAVITNLIKNKTQGKITAMIQITEKDLDLSKDEQSAINKLGFTPKALFQ